VASGGGGTEAVEVAARCLEALRTRGESLATAESLTAGLVSATIAAVPGASDVLRGGLTSYATDVKVARLGVDAAAIARYSVISAEVAEQMAVGARALFVADWAVSTTGVAGPDSQDGHPVGEVYVAVAAATHTRVRKLQLAGDRAAIRRQAVDAALGLLAACLESE
jgi:nicotinamide-nucleotide amidase